MNKNVLIVLAGGFLIAVLVAVLVQASLNGGSKQPIEVAAVREEPMVQIIVAARDLKIGDELRDENMRWQDWPKNGVFPGATVRQGDAKPSAQLNGRLRYAVKAGEPVDKSALIPADQTGMLSAMLSEGMRAVSIDVNASGIVSGFVGPGDFVDIVMTYNDRIRYDGESREVEAYLLTAINNMASETIMENVKVLAVDQSQTRSEDNRVRVGKTVTLEVDQRGAETLALASRMGNLSLMLRRLGDDKVGAANQPVVTDARLTRIRSEVYNEISKKENNSSQRSNIVRVYRGGDMQEIAVTP